MNWKFWKKVIEEEPQWSDDRAHWIVDNVAQNNARIKHFVQEGFRKLPATMSEAIANQVIIKLMPVMEQILEGTKAMRVQSKGHFIPPNATEYERGLYRQMWENGMDGNPVLCTCGFVYSDRWSYCLKCKKRAEDLPPLNRVLILVGKPKESTIEKAQDD